MKDSGPNEMTLFALKTYRAERQKELERLLPLEKGKLVHFDPDGSRQGRDVTAEYIAAARERISVYDTLIAHYDAFLKKHNGSPERS